MVGTSGARGMLGDIPLGTDDMPGTAPTLGSGAPCGNEPDPGKLPRKPGSAAGVNGMAAGEAADAQGPGGCEGKEGSDACVKELGEDGIAAVNGVALGIDPVDDGVTPCGWDEGIDATPGAVGGCAWGDVMELCV